MPGAPETENPPTSPTRAPNDEDAATAERGTIRTAGPGSVVGTGGAIVPAVVENGRPRVVRENEG